MPAFAIASRLGVLTIELPLNPGSPQPMSSAMQRMMFGLLAFVVSEKTVVGKTIAKALPATQRRKLLLLTINFVLTIKMQPNVTDYNKKCEFFCPGN